MKISPVLSTAADTGDHCKKFYIKDWTRLYVLALILEIFLFMVPLWNKNKTVNQDEGYLNASKKQLRNSSFAIAAY